MSVRNWTTPNLNCAFFPVERIPVFCRSNGKEIRLKNYCGIREKGMPEPISVVSSKYDLVTNFEAYERGGELAVKLFKVPSMAAMHPFSIRMSRTKGNVQMDFVRDVMECFTPIRNDKWLAFMRITNSYNRTRALNYEIGFCRWICQNGMIFNAESVEFKINHQGKTIETFQYLKNKSNGLERMIDSFSKNIQDLQKIEMDINDMVAIFCMLFPTENLDVDVEELSEQKKQNIEEKRALVLNHIKDYTNEMGMNAYSALNVLTDYASFPNWRNSDVISESLTGPAQRRVGTWMHQFLEASRVADFSVDKYIPTEARKQAEKLLKFSSGEKMFYQDRFEGFDGR